MYKVESHRESCKQGFCRFHYFKIHLKNDSEPSFSLFTTFLKRSGNRADMASFRTYPECATHSGALCAPI